MSDKNEARAEAEIRKFIAASRHANDDFERCELGHANIIHSCMVAEIKFKDTEVGLDAEQIGKRKLLKLIELSSSRFNAYQSCIELISLLVEDGIPVPKELSKWSVDVLNGAIKRPSLKGKRTSGQVKHEMLVVGCMHIAEFYGFPRYSNRGAKKITAADIVGKCLYPNAKDPAVNASTAYRRAMEREEAFDH